MFGLDIGVISGALQFIGDAFHASDVAKGMDRQQHDVRRCCRRSRRWCAFLPARPQGVADYRAVLFVVSSLLCAAAWSTESLIVFRVILGVAIGIATFTAPLYISEIAPADKRGAMISSYQLMITVGILAAFISDTLFSLHRRLAMDVGDCRGPGRAIPDRRRPTSQQPTLVDDARSEG